MKTMKIMRRLMGCAAAILALSACSESEDLLSAFHSNPNAVRITAQVGKASADGFTRSNPLGTAEEQAKFNENDEISVQAEGQDAVTYKYDGKEWQPQGGKFLKWEKETMNFTAYYPASFNGTITQPTEYNSLESLAAADFMSYSGPQTNTKDNKRNQLTLVMNRMMARVVVEIAGFNDQYTKNATVNSLSICGVKAYKHSDNKFYALIDPSSTPSTTAPFLSLEVADGESKTTETLTTIPTTFVAGKSYTYQLKVGKNKISVSGITVKDWDNTGIITEGSKAEQIIPYVTFTANGEQKFKMTTKNYTISGLEYSVNDGEWATVEAGTEVTFGGTNGNLRLRGTNTYGTASAWNKYSTITFTNNVNVTCTGDIRTLMNWRNYSTVDTQYAKFCYLFKDCAVLTSAPELPATKLADDCYNSMFQGCTSLTAAPNLNATTLADGCYSGMFYGCTSLTAAPELNATTLVSHCYTYMFESCTSLTSAPELKATTLAASCYDNMFYGCTKLSTVTMLAPSDQISKATYCCYNWLYNAGTDGTVKSRTLKVQDAAAYTALESNTDYLPDNWKKGTAGTTVKKEDNTEIK
jgi:tetrahydromethanopterin S-methyltransferase subunit B